MKKVLIKRKWFWWEVVVYSGYELGAPIEYVYPKKFFRKANAKLVAKGIRFSNV
jgi:hypothetical protein